MGTSKIKEYLTAYFKGKQTPINGEIETALRLADDEVNAVAKHYYTGGSPKSSQAVFYFSERTYYRRLSKLTELIKKIVQ